MKKIINLLKSHSDLILYLVFGVLTTLVNYLVYLPCYNLLSINAALSNVIAWCVSVAFAFLTNKPFVFRSHDWSLPTVTAELVKFLTCRLGSGAAETLILLVAVDVLHGSGNIWKIVTSVLVVVLNYFASKLIVFRKS